MPDRPRTARLPPLDSSYRYPHELLELLVDTLPRLVRSKARLIDFFEDAGTPAELLAGWRARVEADRQGVNKFHITRAVLRSLNELDDRARPARREILRRVATSKDFSACWDDDREKAETLVGWVREVASDKDARTWGDSLEEAFRRRQATANYERRLRSVERERRALEELKRGVYRVFALPEKVRGPALAAALPRLFEHFGIPARGPFVITPGGGSGPVDFEGRTYLVELRWQSGPVDAQDIAGHFVRVYSRPELAGLFISASGFTPEAIAQCVRALEERTCLLCELEELIGVLDADADMSELLARKVLAARGQKNPLVRPLNP
jgi:hypothetical protein